MQRNVNDLSRRRSARKGGNQNHSRNKTTKEGINDHGLHSSPLHLIMEKVESLHNDGHYHSITIYAGINALSIINKYIPEVKHKKYIIFELWINTIFLLYNLF